jgi:hemerythrin
MIRIFLFLYVFISEVVTNFKENFFYMSRAKISLYNELKARHDELMEEVKFIEKMMVVSDGAVVLEKNHKKEVCANIINHIDSKDDEDEITIEEYVVEANFFIKVFNKLLGWKRGHHDENKCIQ